MLRCDGDPVILAPYPKGRAPASIARACGVSVRTARRWRNAGHMPQVYALGLRVIEDGDLGALAPAWRGWILKPAALVTPEGWEFSPGDIQAAPILRQLVSELENRLRRPQQYELLSQRLDQ